MNNKGVNNLSNREEIQNKDRSCFINTKNNNSTFKSLLR